MKKHQQSAKYRIWNERHAAYSEKKSAEYSSWRRRKNRLNARRESNRARVIITAPVALSLVYEAEEFSDFLGQLLGALRRDDDIFVDLSGVEEISQGAVMALIAALESSRVSSRSGDIEGSWPTSDKANKLLVASGFADYVNRGRSRTPPSADFYPITSGTLAETRTAKSITEFYMSHVQGEIDPVQRSRIYGSIIECMTNTLHHAYSGPRNQVNRWWVMAHHDQARQCVQISFFDQGMGIPTTVAKRYLESMVSRAATTDSTWTRELECKVLKSAMNGEQRTSTRKKHRGKGLLWIYDSQRAGHIASLRVISNHANFDGEAGEATALSAPLNGTLFSWAIPTQPTLPRSAA